MNLLRKELNDFELLYMAHQKDEAAYRLLIEKYSALIYHCIFNRVDRRQVKFVKEDVYQEGINTLVNSVDSYRDDCGVLFSSFCMLCINRRLSDIVKQMRKGKYLSVSEYSLDAPIDRFSGVQFSDCVEDTHYEYRPEEYTRGRVLKELLIGAADTLNEEEKKIFLYKSLGYNYKELAELSNMSSKKVDNLLQKARKRLKKELDDKENS